MDGQIEENRNVSGQIEPRDLFPYAYKDSALSPVSATLEIEYATQLISRNLLP